MLVCDIAEDVCQSVCNHSSLHDITAILLVSCQVIMYTILDHFMSFDLAIVNYDMSAPHFWFVWTGVNMLFELSLEPNQPISTVPALFDKKKVSDLF